MNEIKAPRITIDGKAVQAKPPKAKVWRQMLRLQSSENDMESEAGFDEQLEFIAAVFGREEVTPDAIEENTTVGEVFSLFTGCCLWVQFLIESTVPAVPAPPESAKNA